MLPASAQRCLINCFTLSAVQYAVVICCVKLLMLSIIDSIRSVSCQLVCGARSHFAVLKDHVLPAPMHPCRAGSVCLDVINQTWSPMFGKQACSLFALHGLF